MMEYLLYMLSRLHVCEKGTFHGRKKIKLHCSFDGGERSPVIGCSAIYIYFSICNSI